MQNKTPADSPAEIEADMHSKPQAPAGKLLCRPWQQPDDPALHHILLSQAAADPLWPPQYARRMDLLQWLAAPADLRRWVCLNQHQVVGHIGLGSLKSSVVDIFCTATGYPGEQFAELCRTVVAAEFRSAGAAALLTRTAIKASLTMQRIPVATVLTGRKGWLRMMLNTGWTRAGERAAIDSDERLVCLLPPARFIKAATGS